MLQYIGEHDDVKLSREPQPGFHVGNDELVIESCGDTGGRFVLFYTNDVISFAGQSLSELAAGAAHIEDT